jgi:hypothetical protein
MKTEAEKVRKALKNGEIDPNKLATMTSAERNAFLSKFVGQENATYVNSLFESKLLLQNQKAGMISWAKKVVGITPTAKRDMLSKIARLDRVLDPKEGEQFLHDLATTRLGVDITQEEAKQIADLSKAVTDSEKLASKEGIFPTEKDRLTYGANKVALETYMNDLKLESGKISFRQEPARKIAKIIAELPGATKSAVLSFDNSFWGTQGLKTVADPFTTKTWVKGFLKSWVDMGRQITSGGKWYTSGDNAVMDTIKADIYSRPNAVNRKYSAGGYGLDVLSEEAYPSSLPEKVPLIGRLFKASEVAYNGGALRLRADLADREIKLAEKVGVNTLNNDEAKSLGKLVSSITGRGSLGKLEPIGKELNVLFTSVKFLRSIVDPFLSIPRYAAGKVGVMPFKNKGEEFAAKEYATKFIRIIATLSSILTIAKLLDPNSVDEDPRKGHMGKIKINGQWVDISGKMGSIITLASKMVPTTHNGEWGFWYVDNKGEYQKMEGKYGQQTPLDILEGFFEGKLSPFASIFRDIWKRSMYGGKPVTAIGELKNVTTPILVKNIKDLKNPNGSINLGAMIFDALGFSATSNIVPNKESGIIKEGSKVSNGDIISYVTTYANAIGTDPETAFNRIFSGQRIKKVSGGMVIVERMPLSESTAVKKKLGGDNPTMKLDHTIPLELEGDNSPDNLKLVTTSQWKSYTPVENALTKAVKAKKIDKKTAQQLIVDFKAGKMTKDQVLAKLK